MNAAANGTYGVFRLRLIDDADGREWGVSLQVGGM